MALAMEILIFRLPGFSSCVFDSTVVQKVASETWFHGTAFLEVNCNISDFVVIFDTTNPSDDINYLSALSPVNFVYFLALIGE